MDLFSVRLPRRLLSCWVPHPWPAGAPPMTYGRSVRGHAAPSVFSQRHAMASRGPRSGPWLCVLRGRQLRGSCEAAEQSMAWRPVVSMPVSIRRSPGLLA
eukprot:2166355-Prymnesium_polylepis.2